jgi:twinkle protein
VESHRIDVAEYLRSKGFKFTIENRPQSGPQAVMNCPFCEDHERKFAISLTSGAFQCLHENRCGRRGSFYEFRRELGDPVGSGVRSTRGEAKAYQKPDVHGEPLRGDARRYLMNERKISAETIRAFRIGMKGEAIAFPYFKNGEVVNVKYRTIGPDKKMWQEKGAEPVVYNRDAIAAEAQELIICEGEIDALSWKEYGYDAVSLPSGSKDQRWIEHEWEWLERFSRIYLSFDMDSAGSEAVGSVARRLGLWRCMRVFLPKKDANECLVEGVTRDEIGDAIIYAVGFDIDEMVKPADAAERYIELREDPQRYVGQEIVWKRMNRILRGWRPGEVTIWTGQNGSGKTTALNQAMVDHLFRNGESVMMLSLEMRVERLFGWIADSLLDAYQADAVRRLASQMDGRLWFYDFRGMLGEDQLLEAMSFATQKYGIRTFVIDSMMRIALNRRGSDELEGQKDFVDRLVAFANLHEAHVHLVVHPRKGMNDDQRPSKVAVAGSGDITNLVSNVVWIWRPSRELAQKAYGEDTPVTNVAAVLKNREFGGTGYVPLVYEQGRRRFTEYERTDDGDEEGRDEGNDQG